MSLLRPPSVACLVLLSIVACANDPTSARPSDAIVSNGAAEPSPSAPDAPNANGSSDGGEPTSATGTSPAAACTPPGRDVISVPTPGRCQGDVATTCDPATATLREEACGPSAECKTFELDERRFDRDNGTGAMLPSRKIPWAACVPKGAQPCALAFNSLWLPTSTPNFACDGDAEVSCRVPNLPKYPAYTTDGWQLAVGSPTGWRIAHPCPAGTTCRKALSQDVTACLPKTAKPCGTDPGATRCEAGKVVDCDPGFGYERVVACTAAESCQSACGASFSCSPTGSPTCDPLVASLTCATPTSFAKCSSTTCRKEVEDCSFILVATGGALQNVPGRCAVVGGAPRCIRTTDILCGPTFVERCDATKAVRCVDGLEHPVDCAGSNTICALAGGHAGCRAPQAASCSPSSGPHCAGNAVVDCCASNGASFAAQSNVCVPGFEVRLDCGKQMLSCLSHPPFSDASCVVP